MLEKLFYKSKDMKKIKHDTRRQDLCIIITVNNPAHKYEELNELISSLTELEFNLIAGAM